jgi:uncharacterized membrane protein
MVEDNLNDSEWDNPANWWGGFLYHSSLDTRSIVPQRTTGFGVTLNLARPAGLAIGLALAFGIVALLVVGLRRV